jgi:hypothetical protein
MSDSEGRPDSSARIQILVALIGLAGVIAAAVIANWGSLFHRTAAAPSAASASSTTGKKTERPVFSSGELMVRGTWHCDLDAGAETAGAADFWWQEYTPVKRSLTPQNGAAFYVVGVRDFDSLKFAELEHFPFSAQPIDGSDVKGENDIPKGTVVAYRTRQSRLGKLLIESYGRNLTIRWVTYEK